MKPITRIKRELSLELARQIRARDTACFMNALQALALLKDPTARYVEGYALDIKGLPVVFYHGWVECEDGRGKYIVETTPSWLGKGKTHYFAGIRYTHTEILAKVHKRGARLPVNSGELRLVDENRAAHDAASKLLYGPEVFERLSQMAGWDRQNSR